jgi:hypothetical protein
MGMREKVIQEQLKKFGRYLAVMDRRTRAQIGSLDHGAGEEHRRGHQYGFSIGNINHYDPSNQGGRLRFINRNGSKKADIIES